MSQLDSGQRQPTHLRRLRVFLCHSSQDKHRVRQLYHQLKTANVGPWLDEEDLLPGQDWEVEIRKAVHQCDIVIVCLSEHSINKVGFVQKEIKIALDAADERPEGTIFLIPLRLEECKIPGRLRRWHWVNYFDEGAFDKLMQALKLRAQSLGEVAPIGSLSDHEGLVSPQVQNSVSSDPRGQPEQTLPFLNEDNIKELASSSEVISQVNESQGSSSTISAELMLPTPPTSKTATDSSKTLTYEPQHVVVTNPIVPLPIAVSHTVLAPPSVPSSPISSPHTLQPAIVPSMPPAVRRGLIRRKLILFVGLILLIVGGSISLVKFSLFATGPTIVPPSTATANAPTIVSPSTAIAAAYAYTAGTTASGVMVGFDSAHTHWNPYEKVLNRTNVSDLGPLWSYGTDKGIVSSPVIANGVVYVGSKDHKFYAFDVSCRSGCQPLWSYPTGSVISSPPQR